MSLRHREYSLESLEQRMLLSGDGFAPVLAPTNTLPGYTPVDIVLVNEQTAGGQKNQGLAASNALVDTTPVVTPTAAATETATPAQITQTTSTSVVETTTNVTPTTPVSVPLPADPSVDSAADFSVKTLTAGNGPPASTSLPTLDDLDPPFGGFNFTGSTQADADALEALFAGTSSSPVTFHGTAEKQDGTLKLAGTFSFAKNGSVFEAGFTNVTGELKAGGVTLNLTIAKGAFTVIGNLATPATGGVAGFAEITTVSLSGVGGGNAFTFSLTSVNLSLNTTGADASAAILVGADLVTFTYAGPAQQNFIRVSGSMTLGITTSAVSVSLKGDFGFEITTIGVNKTIAFAFAAGEADLTVAGVTLRASGLNGAFMITNAGVAGWASVGSIAMTPASTVFSFGELSGVSVNLNTTGADAAANIAVGSSTASFNYSGSAQQNFFRVTGTVGLTVNQGGINTKIKGTLTFDRSVDTVTSAVILRIAVVDGASSFTAGSTTLSITGINGAFVIKNTGFAGRASVAGITLTGVSGFTFSVTSLFFEINTTNTAVSDSIATGGSPVILDFTAPDRQLFFRVQGGLELGLELGGIAVKLNGTFYFEQYDPDGAGSAPNVVKFAAMGASASFTAGTVKVEVTGVNGGFLINNQGIAGFVTAANISLTGVTGVTASGSALSFSINTTGAATGPVSFGVVGGPTVSFDYSAADELSFVSVGGTIHLGVTVGGAAVAIDGSLAFYGATITDPATSVVTEVVKIGGENLGASVTIGPVVASINEVDFIFVLMDAGVAGRITFGELSLANIAGFTLSATNFAFEFNNTGQEIDQVLAVGAVNQTLQYTAAANELNFFRGSGSASLSFSKGALTTVLTGTFGFEQMTMPNNSTVVKFAFINVDFEIGFGSAGRKLVVDDANGFFIFGENSSGVDSYAGKLEIANVSLVGVTGLTFTVQSFNLEVNTYGEDVSASITRPSAPAFTLSFTGADRQNFIAVGGILNLTITTGGASVVLTGGVYFEKASVAINGGAPEDIFKVSISNASFTLGVGSAAFLAEGINGAFLIKGDGKSAGRLTIGTIKMDGITGFSFTATNILLEYNNTGGAVSALIPLAGGGSVTLAYTVSQANFLKVGATLDLTLKLGGLEAHLEGSFIFENSSTFLKIGFKDITLSVLVSGKGVKVTDVDGAFVVYANGTMAGAVTAGSVSLVGLPMFTFTVTNFLFEINNTNGPVNEPVVFADGTTVNIVYGGNVLRVGATLDLGLTLGGLTASLSGTFVFEKTATFLKIGFKDITLEVLASGKGVRVLDVDGAFVVYTNGTMAGGVTAGSVSLVGLPMFTFSVTNFLFEINNTNGPVSEPVTFADGSTVNIVYSGNVLRVGATLDLGLTLGGLTASLSGTFIFEKTATFLKIGFKDITLEVLASGKGVRVLDVDGAFVVYTNGTMAGGVTAGSVSLVGLPMFTFSVTNFLFEINNTNGPVSEPVTFADGSTVNIVYGGNVLRVGATLELGLNLGGFQASLSGTFIFEKTATFLKIGFKDITLEVLASGKGVRVLDVDGAFVVYANGKMAGGVTAGSVSLVGLPMFTFTVTDFLFEINNTDGPVSEPVTFADGSTVNIVYSGNVLRVGSTLELGLTMGGFHASLSGTFIFEKTSEFLKIGFKDITITIKAGTVTFLIADVDGAVVVYNNKSGLALGLKVGEVSLTGIPGVSIKVTDFFLELNDTGGEVHETVTFADGSDVRLDYDGDTVRFGVSFELKIGGTPSAPFVKLTAIDVVVDTRATGSEHIFEVALLSGMIAIPGLGTITVGAGNLAITADGHLANLDPTKVFYVKVEFGAANESERPGSTGFQWPAWLPIKIEQITLLWADIGNNPGDFVIDLSASIGPLPGLTTLNFAGMVEHLLLDVGKLKDGEFPIISFQSAAVQISGNLFGLQVSGGVVLGMIDFRADGSMIDRDDPNQALEVASGTIFYFGINASVNIAGVGGAGFRLGMADIDPTAGVELVPLQAFLSVAAPVIIEPISGLTLGAFTAGIDFASTLEDEHYEVIANLKAVTIANSLNPSLATWAAGLKQSTLSIYNGASVPGVGSSSVWDQPMVITAAVTLYSSYVSQQALNGTVMIKIDTEGRILLIGELLFGGGNLKLDAKIYADLSKVATGDVVFSFYASVKASAGPAPLELWGVLNIRVLDANHNSLAGDPDHPAPIGGAAILQIELTGGARFNAGGALIVQAEGNIKLEVNFGNPAAQVTTLVFNAQVGVVEPTPNPLGPNFGEIAGTVVILTTPGGDFDMYGAAKITFTPASLAKYGIDISAQVFLQINTTAIAQDVKLVYFSGAEETVTIRKESFSLYVKGDLKLGAPNSKPADAFITMNGFVIIEINSDGLTFVFDVDLTLAPKGTRLLTLKAKGFMRINADGIAARLDMTLDTNFPPSAQLEFDATYTLILNTTKKIVSYDIPEFVQTPGGPTNITIAQAAPAIKQDTTVAAGGVNAPGEMYYLIAVEGKLTALGTLTIEGSYFILITESVVQMQVDAKLSLEPVGNLEVNGFLELTTSGAAGQLNISTNLDLSQYDMVVNGTFLVAFNTYATEYELPNGSKLKAKSIRVEINGTVTIGSSFDLVGRFFFEKAGSVTRLELSATLSMPILGTLNVDGVLVLTTDGAVGSLVAVIKSGKGLSDVGITFNATMALKVNTTDLDADDPSDKNAADGIDQIAHNSITLDLKGSVTLLAQFTFDGHFYFSENAGGLHIVVAANLDIAQLGVIAATGDFDITDTGFTAKLTLTLTTASKLADLGFSLSGAFLFAINNESLATLPNGFTLTGLTGKLAVFNGVTLTKGSSVIFLNGKLTLFGTLDLEGTFEMRVTPDYLELKVDATLDVGGLISLHLVGAAGIYSDGIALKINLTTPGLDYSPIFSLTGKFVFELNTTGTEHFGIEAESFRIAVTNVVLDFLDGLLKFEGSIDIHYTNGEFRLDLAVHTDFFGIVTVDVRGYFDTLGNYDIRFLGEFFLGVPDFLGFGGSIDLHVASFNSVLSISGGLHGKAYILGFKVIDGFLQVNYDGLSGRLSVTFELHIDFFFFSIDEGITFDIGTIKPQVVYPAGSFGNPTPLPGTFTGGALYINVGSRAVYRGYSLDEPNEQIIIKQAPNGAILVDVNGRKARYDNVTEIHINAGTGNDNIVIDPTVDKPLFIDTGDGHNVVLDNGTGKAVITGGAGNDQIDGGSGNDTISGGGGKNILRGNGGKDTITGGSDDDLISGGTEVDTLTGGDGNDTFIWSVGDGIDSINGNAGVNSLTIIGTTGPDQLGITPAGTNFTVTINNETLTPVNVQSLVADLLAGNDTVTVSPLESSHLNNLDFFLGAGTDSVTIEGDSTTDVFRLTSSADTVNMAKLVNATSQTSLVDYRIHDSTYPIDRLTINGNGGDDLIDAANVTHARLSLTLNGGDGSDMLIGSSFNDQINGGDGDDFLTGGPGVDIFTDTDGTNELIENMDVDYTLNGWQFTAGGQVEALPAVFATIRLNGGNGNNTFTLSNIAATIYLNGDEGSDNYIINASGTGMRTVNIVDGGTGVGFTNTNTLRIYGTASPDDFLLREGVISIGNTAAHNEVVNFAGMSAFEIYAGAGGDNFIVDETSVVGKIYGEGGEDNFTVGRILAPEGQPAPAGIRTIDTTRGFMSYGNRAVLELRGGDNDDTFEVNHNQAELKLYGENGDDLFIIRSFLEEGSAISNVNGGTGTNSINYVKNGPVVIDGGEGFDRLVIEGTEADDVFVITDRDIFGGGRKISFTSIESIVILGGLGNDTFWVLGNGLPLEINGGSGNDTINIGGQAPDYVYDAPEVTVDPAPYTTYVPVYSASYTYTYTVSGHYSLTNSFPYFTWVKAATYTITIPKYFLRYDKVVIDPPPTTYDPPAETYRFANVTNFNGIVNGVEVYVSKNNTPVVPGPGVNPTRRFDLGKINAPVKVTGGADFGIVGENDRMNVNLAGTTGNLTGRLFSTIETRGEKDGTTTIKDPVGQLLGLGLPDIFTSEGRTFMGGIIFDGLESAVINLGSGNDTFTIGTNAADAAVPGVYDGTFGAVSVTVNGNAGNDTFSVRANSGTVTLNGDAGNDTFNLGSNASVITNGILDRLQGGITVNGGANTDILNLDDRGDTTVNELTLTQTTINGMGFGAAGVTYGTLESLVIGFGSGADIANVRGTANPTTLQLNDGDDAIYVSSTAAVTNATRPATTSLGGHLDDIDATLQIDAGNGRHRLLVSDAAWTAGRGTALAPAVLTDSSITGLSTGVVNYSASASGNFADGITLWTGSGADFIDVTSQFLRAGLRNSTSLNTGGGADTVRIQLPAATNGLFALHAGAGDDIIHSTGSLVDLLIFGGDGNDAITTNSIQRLIFGDEGSVLYRNEAGALVARYGSGGVDDFTDGVIRFMTFATTVSPTVGGNDTIITGAGDDLIFGGTGADTINTGNGRNMVFGDFGSATWAGGILFALESVSPGFGGNDTLTGGSDGDILIGGEGADAVQAGEGVNIVLGDEGRIEMVGARVGVVISVGGLGTDRITTGAGNDLIAGGGSGDVINAGEGANAVFGDHGRFDLAADGAMTMTSLDYGIGGADDILTGTGADFILGGQDADTINGGEGNNVIFGDSGEIITSAIGLVRIRSLAAAVGGNDIIRTGAGNDVILGGAGADQIYSGAGNDLVLGDSGVLDFTAGSLTQATSSDYAAGGDDIIDTGEGSDFILGGFGADTINAGEGDNLVLGDQGTVIIAAGVLTDARTDAPTYGAGDTVTTGSGNDFIMGGLGGDTINAGEGNNVILGDHGELHWVLGILARMLSTDFAAGGFDVITSGAGADMILAGPGADTVRAGRGKNIILGDSGSFKWTSGVLDFVTTLEPGVGGDDTIETGIDTDVIFGGAGADTIRAGAGADLIVGDAGTLTLSGGTVVQFTSQDFAIGGADSIFGEAGNDLIIGGAAGDQIDGGEDQNVIAGDNAVFNLPGGVLAEVLALAPAIGGADTITVGQGQNIVMAGAAGDTITTGDGGNIIVGDHATLTFVNGIFNRLTPTTPEIGGNDTIRTGAGADIIIGGTGRDWIDAGAGNDVIAGDHALLIQPGGVLTTFESVAPAEGDADIIYGGLGNDLILGGTGGDTIYGGEGNDLVFGDHASVTGTITLSALPLTVGNIPFSYASVFTQNLDAAGRAVAGDDVVFAGVGDDLVFGQQGADIIFGQDGDDDLVGGHNVSLGQDGGDIIDGGAGYDVIAGDNATMVRTGTNFSLRVRVLVGTAIFDDRGNLLVTDAAQAWPTAVPERTTVLLDHAFNTATGLYGADTLIGGAGDDTLFGELGNDSIHGDAALPVVIGADGTVDRAAVRASAAALFTTNLWVGADTDGDDYIEGNGGNDLIFGGLGQDDIVGGSSSMFGLLTRDQRPDGSDTIYGGNGTAADDADMGDTSPNGRARDADVILGDNANIVRLVGLNGVSSGAFLHFPYDTSGTIKIIVRGFELLDYTIPNSPDDLGATDTLYGEAGDDSIHGMTGDDTMLGNGQDDNLYGGQGDDLIYGGGGDDSISHGDELKAAPPVDNGAASTPTKKGGGSGANNPLPTDTGSGQPAVPSGIGGSSNLTPGSTRINGGNDFVFGNGGNDWMIFGSPIFPSTRFGAPTAFLAPTKPVLFFDQSTDEDEKPKAVVPEVPAEGEIDPTVMEVKIPAAPEQPAEEKTDESNAEKKDESATPDEKKDGEKQAGKKTDQQEGAQEKVAPINPISPASGAGTEEFKNPNGSDLPQKPSQP